MSAALLIPARNEGDRLRILLSTLLKMSQDLSRLRQVILVLDGCTDDSIRHARSALSDWAGHPAQLIVVERNLSEGKAAAVRSGLAVVDADYVITWDADLEYGLAGLPAIIAALCPCTLISGVRQAGLAWRSRWANRLVRSVLRRHGQPSADILTGVHAGPISLFEMGLAQSTGYTMEAALVALALRLNYYCLDLPLPYRPRDFAAGRGIRARDLIPILETAVSPISGGYPLPTASACHIRIGSQLTSTIPHAPDVSGASRPLE